MISKAKILCALLALFAVGCTCGTGHSTHQETQTAPRMELSVYVRGVSNGEVVLDYYVINRDSRSLYISSAEEGPASAVSVTFRSASRIILFPVKMTPRSTFTRINPAQSLPGHLLSVGTFGHGRLKLAHDSIEFIRDGEFQIEATVYVLDTESASSRIAEQAHRLKASVYLKGELPVLSESASHP